MTPTQFNFAELEDQTEFLYWYAHQVAERKDNEFEYHLMRVDATQGYEGFWVEIKLKGNKILLASVMPEGLMYELYVDSMDIMPLFSE